MLKVFLTKITGAQSEVTHSYQRVCEIHFLLANFAATIVYTIHCIVYTVYYSTLYIIQ